MGLFFYNSKTGVGTVDLFLDGKLREKWPKNGFRSFGKGWTAASSTQDNLLLYNQTKGNARLASIVRLGTLNVFPAKTTMKGFSSGWTVISQVAPDAMIFYNKDTGGAAIGRLANGVFATTNPAMQLKHGWSHIEALPGFLLFYDAEQGLAALTPFNGAGPLQQGLGDVFEFEKGYSHLVAVENVIWPTNHREHWLLAYDSATGNGGVFTVQDGRPVKTADYIAGFATGWDIVVAESGYVFYYEAGGNGVVGRIVEGRHETLWRYDKLSSGWTHIVPFAVTDLGPG